MRSRAPKIVLTRTAFEHLKAIKDQRIQQQIKVKMQMLREAPYRVGKPLVGPLKGFYSLRAAGQRHRIIYVVNDETVVRSHC